MKFDKSKIVTPDIGIDYPENSEEHLVFKPHIHELTLDENYPYIDKSFGGRFMSNLMYLGIVCLCFWLNPLLYGLKICGRKNFTKNKKLFKNGAITVSNHVYRWDFLAVLQAIRFKRPYFPAWAENLKTNDRGFIRKARGIPIPEGSYHATGKFNAAFDEVHEKKGWIHVYPESCRWDYYQYIRPFRKGAFNFAYKYQLPVIPMAFSYRKPTGLSKLFLKDKPAITLNVGEPIMPDLTLSRKESITKLRDECHAKVLELAGLSPEENKWTAGGND